MFQLAAATAPGWARSVAAHHPELLLEHAHLERKAASTAIALMFRHPERDALQRPLSELAREELGHFELVFELMQRRGITFGPQAPSPYAGRLLQVVRRDEPDQLVDRLLCAAVIEARSCERMQELARMWRSEDPELASFYGSLLAAEAGHFATYVGLARGVVDAEVVAARLQEICAWEVKVLAAIPSGPRMHAGGLVLPAESGHA